MKKALIIHGWDGSPEEPLCQYLKKELEARGYEVTIPTLPDPAVPVIEKWVRAVGEAGGESSDLIIGHSIGCQAVLRYLETLPQGLVIPKVILIAPWMRLDEQTIAEEGEETATIAKPWMETPIDFNKIKSHIGSTVATFSDDDPYVPADHPELFKRELNASVFIEHNQGHFTISDNFQSLQTPLNNLL